MSETKIRALAGLLLAVATLATLGLQSLIGEATMPFLGLVCSVAGFWLVYRKARDAERDV